ncbi:monooxygenase [Aspergillus heteromorphus CBS 117.55]|uniref:Monooxygenase n=1 Tax=Aspergillus heteromorphus CBS 117.55 TaxID=1448321 RepID=A0A317VU77_9EURO|nr:monooxygenase [Aspergillus heteromorphus CBS 117.55]PWY75420.1 monooxygenase [Aspergillus heteromorphus CBS 117.55]
MSGPRQFHVVIVGASISGLTLAHCLSSTSIKFTVLEARSNSFNDGAGLVILPNGARILDQLGLYRDVLDWGVRMDWHSTWLDDGRLLKRVNTRQIGSVRRRTGYPLIVIARRALLGIIFTRLRDKHRVFFNRRVSRIISTPEGVTVHSTDGSSVSGDLVVGADGVYSTVRSQMWRHIKGIEDGAGRHISEVRLKVAYVGVFGISHAFPALERGHVHRAYGHGWSTIIMAGPESKVFWFVSIARPSTDKSNPRHSCDSSFLSGIVAPLLEKYVASDVTFGEIFNRTDSYVFVPLEESLQTRWSWGRFAGVGDAMTPNIAEGANCAIESAASLANHLNKFVRESDDPYKEDGLHSALKTWEDSRRHRVKFLFTLSQLAVRVEAATNWGLKLLRRCSGVVHGVGISWVTDLTPHTARVDYLPLQRREGTGRASKNKGQKQRRITWFSAVPLAATVSLVLHVFRTMLG